MWGRKSSIQIYLVSTKILNLHTVVWYIYCMSYTHSSPRSPRQVNMIKYSIFLLRLEL